MGISAGDAARGAAFMAAAVMVAGTFFTMKYWAFHA